MIVFPAQLEPINEERHVHCRFARVSPHARYRGRFCDYVCAGSYEEETLRANVDDLQNIKLRQRVLVDMSGRDLTTTILGEKVPLPIALAPVALTGLQHGNGEILAARAANDAGIPFTLSTMSICSIEQVAAATGKPFWFQLYMMRDRGFVAELIGRARSVNCSALVLTVDLQVSGATSL